MTMKQTAKYSFAVAVGFVLSTATNNLFFSPDEDETTIATPGDQLVYLKWRKASVAANVVRESLRDEGFDIAIGSDDSLNAIFIQADKPTTALAIDRIRDLDNHNSVELN